MSGGGGGGNDNAFWAMKKEIDDQRMAVEAETAAKAAEANQKRLTLYSGGGLSALATAGYSGYSSAKTLGTSGMQLGTA
jgi:hypothetical protein